mmetsp:Transcript_40/g.147  ORF Transcript_40/g.147 Transcript_40/m.147 type:complete len:206 (+) Transcript_40:164-781(+)
MSHRPRRSRRRGREPPPSASPAPRSASEPRSSRRRAPLRFQFQFCLFRSFWPFWLCFWSSQSRIWLWRWLSNFCFARRRPRSTAPRASAGGSPRAPATPRSRAGAPARARRTFEPRTPDRAPRRRRARWLPPASRRESGARSTVGASARFSSSRARLRSPLNVSRLGLGRRRGMELDDVVGFVRHVAGFHWCRRVHPRRTIRRGR